VIFLNNLYLEFARKMDYSEHGMMRNKHQDIATYAPFAITSYLHSNKMLFMKYF
jgi:hypothetical protein